MDYTELVKALRESPANKRLMTYAADAIEELAKDINVPRRISATEPPKEET